MSLCSPSFKPLVTCLCTLEFWPHATGLLSCCLHTVSMLTCSRQRTHIYITDSSRKAEAPMLWCLRVDTQSCACIVLCLREVLISYDGYTLSLCLHALLIVKCNPITLTHLPMCKLWPCLKGACCLACRSGQVTQKMLDAPDKRLFLGIGGLEAASQLLGFVGASKLPGHTPLYLLLCCLRISTLVQYVLMCSSCSLISE